MPIEGQDHVNIRTSRLDEMIEFYEDVLELRNGWRPPFSFPGAWMYLGDLAIVHLVHCDKEPTAPADDLKLEHFALRASGLTDFLDKLQARGIAYSVDEVPDYDRVQVNFHDPDGIHIHVDFPADEYQAA